MMAMVTLVTWFSWGANNFQTSYGRSPLYYLEGGGPRLNSLELFTSPVLATFPEHKFLVQGGQGTIRPHNNNTATGWH